MRYMMKNLKLQEYHKHKKKSMYLKIKNHDMMDPQKPVDLPTEVITYQRKPSWARELIQDTEKYGAPSRSFRESKKPRFYSNYVALVSNIIDA